MFRRFMADTDAIKDDAAVFAQRDAPPEGWETLGRARGAVPG
jgi:hypothetical protein